MSHDHHHHGHGHDKHKDEASPVAQHRAHGKRSARCMVVTVSDTRDLASDRSGQRATDLLTEGGHEVRRREIVADDRDAIAALVRAGIADPEIDAVVLTGGTGIAPRDTTFDVLNRKYAKVMPGFGELFRMLSYQEVGAAAMLSRASAGTYRGRVVISTPGSPNAVQVAWEKLIAPEIAHLAWEVAR